MKWMSNLKIRSKLILGFGSLLALMFIVSLMSILRLKQIDMNYTNTLDFPVNRLSKIDDVNLEVANLRRAVLLLVTHMGDTAAITSAENDMNAQLQLVRDKIVIYESYVTSDPTLDDADIQMRLGKTAEINNILDQYYNEIIVDILENVYADDLDSAMEAVNRAADYVGPLTEASQALVTSAEDVVTEKSAENTVIANQAFMLLVGITVMAFIIGISLMFIITSGITKPVRVLNDLLSKVADGDLEVTAASNARDEIGDLTRDVGKVVNVVKSLVTDINYVSNEFEKGEIDAKIDVDKYHGSYKEVALGFNKSLGSVINEALEFIKCMIAFSEGNFEANIEQLPGKKAIMNTSRDQLRDNLMGVNNDIAYLVEKASAGELKTRIDASKYKGDWNTLVESLNGLMESIAIPIGEALASLVELSKGNLSARVTGSYRGQFDEIKSCVNDTMGAVGSYIQEISEILGKMAEENDLTQEIKRQYVGDFDQIKSSINMILSRMNKVMSDFNAASEQVSSGSSLIADSSMALAQGATEQASSVEELNASVETINEQTTKSANDADEANQLSIRSRENALKGNEEMGKMLVSMEDIKKSSDNISKINKVIEDIAFQTNLLALNAAVEAARAGEHGKGFAVVAEEVRNLAARSQSASKETSELIQESIQKVEEGQQIAGATAESLERIVNDFSQVSTIISGIATASKDQASSIEQIAIGLGQISEVVQNNSSTSEEAAATSQELSGQAEMLKNMVAEFKTK